MVHADNIQRQIYHTHRHGYGNGNAGYHIHGRGHGRGHYNGNLNHCTHDDVHDDDDAHDDGARAHRDGDDVLLPLLQHLESTQQMQQLAQNQRVRRQGFQ